MSRERPTNSLFARLARLVGGEAAVRPSPARSTAPRPAVQPVDADLRRAVAAMVKGGCSTLQVISLVEFRDEVGDKWERVAAKVAMIAETVISGHLGAGNQSIRLDDSTFILVFLACSQSDARRRALAIAEDLEIRLHGGQPGERQQRPLALAAEVPAEVVRVGNLGAIHAAVDDMRSFVGDDGATPRRSMLPGGPPVAADLPVRYSLLPSQPPPSVPAAADAGRLACPSGFVDVHGRPRDHAPASDAAPSMPGDARLSVLWRPTWVAEGEAIAAYEARVQRVDGEGVAPLEGCRAYPAGDRDAIVALDRVVVAGAVRALAAAADSDPFTVVVPVHWQSMVSSRRLQVTGAFGDIGEEMRKQRVVLELFGVPAATSAADLSEVLRPLRPLCRAVALRTRLSAPRIDWATGGGAAMVGINLAELAPFERTGDDVLAAAFAELVKAAAASGVGAYLWGARRRPVVAGAVGCGCAMVNGPALMNDVGRPLKILPAARSRFR